MKNTRKSKWKFFILLSMIVVLASCSMMKLNKYQEPSNDLFKSLNSIKGVTAVAKPLFDKEESKKHFGVDLLEKNILAIYLAVSNNNPNVSFTLPSESISIGQIKNGDLIAQPEKLSQVVAEVTGTLGLCLLSHALGYVSIQQSSDATVIREKFQFEKFQTMTIEPGQKTEGFSYFNLEKLKNLGKTELCFKLLDTIAGEAFPFCMNINLRR